MNTVSVRSLSVGFFSATILAALLLAPTASWAQAYNTATGSGALDHNTTGSHNTADGNSALYTNTTGSYNTAEGYVALYSLTTGLYNTANGAYALAYTTTGGYNSANGYGALYYNTTGSSNTANGFEALFFNTTGGSNTANGLDALYKNTTGDYNTANGSNALYSNTTGSRNIANGFNALYFNTTGTENTANGNGALYDNTSGSYNTANGFQALLSNTTGGSNMANGYGSLYANTTGSYNTANGVGALYTNTTGNNNTADGYFALLNSTTGSGNIALGNGAGENNTTGSNNIAIGNAGVAADSGVIRIGTKGTQTDTYISGISGVNVNGGVAVYINSNGKLGTVTSSQRFKYDIHDMGAKSDKLMDLRPVMFRYKEAAEDGSYPLQYGLIAEEVAKVYPDLVQYDKQGKPFTVYYHLLTPMMLNELQKAHQQLASQQTEINSLKATVQNQSSGTVSLQHMVQSLFTVLSALVLVALIGAAYVLSSRARRSPSLRVRPIENCAS